MSCDTSPSRGDSTPTPSFKEPGIYFSSQFYWQKDAQSRQIPIPLTGHNPGPTFQAKKIRHEYGFGSSLKASDLYSAVVASGQQILSDDINHMKSFGWQSLFNPTSTGTFPTYILYVTFRVGIFYCFVEYTASSLDQAQSSQTLDIYYT